MNISLKYWYLLALCLFMWSCEKSSDTLVDPPINSPFIISDSVSVSQIFIDSLHQNLNGTIPVSFTISVRAYDRSGVADIRNVSYSVYPPGSAYAFLNGACILTSTVTDSNIAVYSARISFSMDKSNTGFYGVGVTATTQSSTVSNTLLTQVLISRNYHRPYLTDLVAPDTVVIPDHGRLLLQFAVSVHDTDGYDAISQVFLQRITPTVGSRVPMYDDGDSLHNTNPTVYQVPDGDSLAHDGIFSVIVQADSSNTAGAKLLLFQASNRAGVFSDSLLHTVVFRH